MSTLYVMVGIPASGKSTKAQELVKRGAVKVSSDLIRKELFGEEEIHYTDEWLRENGYDGPDERAAKKKNLQIIPFLISCLNVAQVF